MRRSDWLPHGHSTILVRVEWTHGQSGRPLWMPRTQRGFPRGRNEGNLRAVIFEGDTSIGRIAMPEGFKKVYPEALDGITFLDGDGSPIAVMARNLAGHVFVGEGGFARPQRVILWYRSARHLTNRGSRPSPILLARPAPSAAHSPSGALFKEALQDRYIRAV